MSKTVTTPSSASRKDRYPRTCHKIGQCPVGHTYQANPKLTLTHSQCGSPARIPACMPEKDPCYTGLGRGETSETQADGRASLSPATESDRKETYGEEAREGKRQKERQRTRSSTPGAKRTGRRSRARRQKASKSPYPRRGR